MTNSRNDGYDIGEVSEFYMKEIGRMRKMGYTDEQVEKEIDRMIRIQNMVTMAVF